MSASVNSRILKSFVDARHLSMRVFIHSAHHADPGCFCSSSNWIQCGTESAHPEGSTRPMLDYTVVLLGVTYDIWSESELPPEIDQSD